MSVDAETKNARRRLNRIDNPSLIHELDAKWRRKQKMKVRAGKYVKREEWFCNRCGLTKKTTDFYKSDYSYNGKSTYCKDCTRDYARWSTAKRFDKKFNRGQACTYSEWRQYITGRPCSYCGFRIHVGADRIDCGKSHSIENIVPCCDFCNIARSDHFTVSEMTTELGPAIARIRDRRGDVR